jgi:hypothetical protein
MLNINIHNLISVYQTWDSVINHHKSYDNSTTRYYFLWFNYYYFLIAEKHFFPSHDKNCFILINNISYKILEDGPKWIESILPKPDSIGHCVTKVPKINLKLSFHLPFFPSTSVSPNWYPNNARGFLLLFIFLFVSFKQEHWICENIILSLPYSMILIIFKLKILLIFSQAFENKFPSFDLSFSLDFHNMVDFWALPRLLWLWLFFILFF